MGGLIHRSWVAYRTQVIPGNAPAVQVEETRRAFYAGAAAVFAGVTQGLSSGEEPQESDLAVFDGIQNEIDAHIADMAQMAREETPS